jgi:hypothetical protein
MSPPRRFLLLAAALLSSFVIRHLPRFARSVGSIGFALMLAVSAAPRLSFAVDSPLYIPFQGQVTNQAGTIVADGQYSVIFNLYDQAVGGQPVWSERHVKIGVTRGMINVFLGSIAPFDKGTASQADDVDFATTKYLGITVDVDNLATTADPEMVPRSLIIPAFHAKKAENSTKLAGHDWSAILANASNDPQTGFILGGKIANGSITSTQLGIGQVTNEKLALSSITTDKISNGAVGSDQMADGSVSFLKLGSRPVVEATGGIGSFVKSPPMGVVTYSDSVQHVIPNLSATITTTGRPVVVSFPSGSFGKFGVPGGSTGGGYVLEIYRGAQKIAQPHAILETTVNNVTWTRYLHSNAFWTIDTPPAGQHTYSVRIESSSAGTIEVNQVQMLVFEL